MSKSAYNEQLRIPAIKGSAKKREIAIGTIEKNFDTLQSYARDFDRCGDARTAERCHAAAEAYEMTVLLLCQFFSGRVNTAMVLGQKEKFEQLRSLWTVLEVVDYTDRRFAERTMSYRSPEGFSPRFEGCRKNRCYPLHAVTDPYSILILLGNALLNRRFEQAARCYFKAAERYSRETRELIRRLGPEADCCYMVSNRKQFLRRCRELLEEEMQADQVPHMRRHLLLLEFGS